MLEYFLKEVGNYFLGAITSKKGVKRDKEYHMNVQVLKNSACKSIYNMQSYWKRKEIYNRTGLF